MELAPPAGKQDKEEPQPFQYGAGESAPPVEQHIKEELGDEELTYATSLPYPFKQRLPAWFIDYYSKSGGDNIPTFDMTGAESNKWQKILGATGLSIDQAKSQIYEPDFLNYSNQYRDFTARDGKVSRMEHALLVDEHVRQTVMQNPNHIINALSKGTPEMEKAYFEREGKTYAQTAREELGKARDLFMKKTDPAAHGLHAYEGLGYEIKEIDDEPGKRRIIPIMGHEKERFIQTFLDPQFDFGALDKDGKPLLSANDLVTIWQHQVFAETLSAERKDDGTLVYKREDSGLVPVLKEIAPKNWDKLEKEVQKRVGFASERGGAIIRGLTPFGGKVFPLNEAQSRLRGIVDPNYRTKEMAGGIASLLMGSGALVKAADKLRNVGKAKEAVSAALAGEAILGASYAHASPGYLSELAGKPDSYTLNAIEAATIAGVFQLGFWGFSKLKGRQAGDLGDTLHDLENMSPEEFAEQAALIKKRLNSDPVDYPEPELPDQIVAGTLSENQKRVNWLRKNFLADRGVPSEWAFWERRADHATAARVSGEMSRDLEKLKAQYKAHWNRVPTEEELIDLNRAVQHGNTSDLLTWPKDMRITIRKLRDHRKALTTEFKRSVPNLGEELRFTLDKNFNEYLHRSYRLTDQGEEWLQKILPKGGPKDPAMVAIYKDAHRFLKKQHRNEFAKKYKAKLKVEGKTVAPGGKELEAQLDQLVANEIEAFLKHYEPDTSDLVRLRGGDAHKGKDITLITDVIRKRKKIPVELRNLMGEYKNPFLNYEKTIMKMSQHIEHAKMQANVRSHGMANGWIWPDEALKPPIQVLDDPDLLRGFYGQRAKVERGELFKPTGRGGAVEQAIRDEARYVVEMPPSGVDGVPEIRVFRTKKAAETWRDKRWSGTPHHKSDPIAFAKAGKEHGGFSRIPDSPAFGALRGHWVRRDYHDALLEFNELKKWPTRAGKIWMTGVGLTNVSKTVFSHVTQVRNVIGGYIINAANGRFRYKGGGSTAGALLDDFKNLPDASKAAQIDEWRELGLMGGDIQLRQINEIMSDSHFAKFLNADPDEAAGAFERWGRKITQGVTKKPMKFYGQVDNFFRVAAYEDELRRMTKAYDTWEGTPKKWTPGLEMPPGFYHAEQKTPMNLKQYAAELASNTYQNYDKVPKAVQNWGKAAPIGNFVSFQAEMFRITKNTFKHGMSELRHPNPAIRAMGKRRIASLLAVGAVGSTALKEGWNHAYAGVSDEQEQAILHFLPPFQRNNEIMVTELKNGRVQFFDASYNNPFGFANKAVRAAWLRGHWEDRGAQDIIQEMAGSFVDQKLLLRPILEATANKDEFGRAVYDSQVDGKATIAAKMTAHVAKAFQPGSDKSLRRLWEVATGKREGSIGYEAMAQITGVRHYNINLMNLKTSPLIYKGSEYRQHRSVANRRFNEVMVPGRQVKDLDVSVEDQLGAWHEMNRVAFMGQKKLYQSVKAARLLMLPDSPTRQQQDNIDTAIFKMLNADTSKGSISKKIFFGGRAETDGIVDGVFMPIMPDPEGVGVKAERRGTKFARAEFDARWQKYTRARMSLDGGWTETPQEPVERK